MNWTVVKDAIGGVLMRARSMERRKRQDEWHRADQYDERVRVVETDMRAITAYVDQTPDLRSLPPPKQEED